MDGLRVPPSAAPRPGARLAVYTGWQAELPVVYEDERILLINKPAGLSCDDDGRGGMTVKTLLAERADQPRLCHRLDNQTCGLLIAAKDDVAEQCLLDAFKERRLLKRYECIVKGGVRPAAATLTAYIVRTSEDGKMRVVSHSSPEARPIITEYETMSTASGTSRLRVTLHTGRTHQIRAHMAFIQHPILGDDIYGDRRFNQLRGTRRLMLCSTELTLFAGGTLKDLDGRCFSIQAPF